MKIKKWPYYLDVLLKLKYIMVLFILLPNICLSETYTDTKEFSPNTHIWGNAFWTHKIPKGFFADTAEVKLKIRVYQFNDWGVLDIFCSNSNTFDYGSATTATGKPGFIRRLSRADTPNSDAFYEISGTLKETQLEWLNDDGVIHLALIGDEYRSPAWGGYKAIFYLEFSKLTANVGEISLFTLTVNSSNPASGVEITSTTAHGGTTSYTRTVSQNTNVSLTAMQYHGSGASRKRFMNWSGEVSSTNQTISVTMSANKTVTANYVVEPEQVGKPAWIKIPASSRTGNYMVFWGSSSTGGVTYVLEEATNASFTSGLRQAYSGTTTSASISDRSTGVRYYYRIKGIKTGYVDSAWEKGVNGCLVSPYVPGVLMLLLEE